MCGKCCELDNDGSRLVIVTIQSAVGDTHADGEGGEKDCL